MNMLMCECADMLVQHLNPHANGEKKINITRSDFALVNIS